MDSEGEEAARVLNALKTGIEIEAHGIKFYRGASKEVKDPKGIQTLRFLANEERNHLRFIKDLKDSFEKKDASVKDIIKAHLDLKKGPRIFPEMDEYLEEIRESKEDEKILEEAAEIEKRSIEFYSDSAKSVTNGDYKEIFNVLVGEEEGHLKLIELMTDYMTLHGVWTGLEDYFANE